ncbi:VQ motif-containing protein 20 [Euphorbia lathyris]|uniref:VQ motif-containing protein 20 n=1 Tax=Euphorbia lathyris TaxID=212925 RepID=UPI003313D516
MSPSPSLQDQNPKISNKNASLCPPLLKINKDSHSIKKSSSSILSSSPPSAFSSSASLLTVAAPVKPPPQRTPVIIYTHSPKIIHTNPTDFMALVQKLTGMSRSDDDPAPDHQVKRENGILSPEEESNKNGKMCGNDDNESSSVITTDENCGDGQVNSCFVPPIFEPPNPYMTNIPVFSSNPVEFLCGNQPYYNYTDSLYFNNPNLRTSISSSSSSPMERMNDFPEY